MAGPLNPPNLIHTLTPQPQPPDTHRPGSPLTHLTLTDKLCVCLYVITLPGQTNGGAYIKVGQHISQLDYLLPRSASPHRLPPLTLTTPPGQVSLSTQTMNQAQGTKHTDKAPACLASLPPLTYPNHTHTYTGILPRRCVGL